MGKVVKLNLKPGVLNNIIKKFHCKWTCFAVVAITETLEQTNVEQYT